MKFDHAIILGGGFSGMLAAHLLSSHFEHVTLIERDDLKIQSVRHGIPQSTHLHVLMQHGQQMLEQLMPGILSDMRDQGLQQIDWAKDTKWYGPFGSYPQYPSDVKTLHFSRVLLNNAMCKRIMALNNVTIINGHVLGLSTKDGRVTTIQYTNNTNMSCTLTGDLIIDARGRNSNASELLLQQSYSVLPPRIVKPDLGYASCVYNISGKLSHNFKQIYLQVRPGKMTKGVVISTIEKNQMIVTALGLGGNKPSRNEVDFQQFLAELPCAELQDYLSGLLPAGSISLKSV